MSEEKPGLTETLLYIVKFLFSAGVIIFLIVLFTSFRPVLKLNSMERFSIELAENIGQHNLTGSRMILDMAELDKYDGTINEPYVRQCEYGYSVRVEALEEKTCQKSEECRSFCAGVCGIESVTSDNCKCDKSCQCKKGSKWIKKYEWEFGYEPHDALYYGEKSSSHIERAYPVSIGIQDSSKPYSYYDTVMPAGMTLSVYDTWLTRITCMAETAYTLKETQITEIPCLRMPNNPEFFECSYPIGKKLRSINSDVVDVCLFYMENGAKQYTEDCRHLEVPLYDFYYYYSDKTKQEVFLKAIPLKKIPNNLPPSYTDTGECGIIKDIISDAIAGKNDEVKTVILCIERVSKE